MFSMGPGISGETPGSPGNVTARDKACPVYMFSVMLVVSCGRTGSSDMAESFPPQLHNSPASKTTVHIVYHFFTVKELSLFQSLRSKKLHFYINITARFPVDGYRHGGVQIMTYLYTSVTSYQTVYIYTLSGR